MMKFRLLICLLVVLFSIIILISNFNYGYLPAWVNQDYILLTLLIAIILFIYSAFF